MLVSHTDLPCTLPVGDAVFQFCAIGAVETDAGLHRFFQGIDVVEEHHLVMWCVIIITKCPSEANAFLCKQAQDKGVIGFLILIAVRAPWIAFVRLVVQTKMLAKHRVIVDVFLQNCADDLNNGFILKVATVDAQVQRSKGGFNMQNIAGQTTVAASKLGASDNAGDDAVFVCSGADMDGCALRR